MVPGAAVVPRPRRSVPLASGVGGACKHHGTQIGIQFLQTLEGRTRILHAVDVVYLRVGRGAFHEAWLVDPMNDIERHGPRGRAEDGRLVHVIPKARNALPVEILIQSAEPGARLLPGKVGKDTRARPYFSNID